MNFNNNEFTLLSDEQTFGSQQIDVIKKIGRKCAISDFAILLGAYVSSDYHVDGDNSMRGRIGWWYLSSSDGYGALVVSTKIVIVHVRLLVSVPVPFAQLYRSQTSLTSP